MVAVTDSIRVMVVGISALASFCRCELVASITAGGVNVGDGVVDDREEVGDILTIASCRCCNGNRHSCEQKEGINISVVPAGRKEKNVFLSLFWRRKGLSKTFFRGVRTLLSKHLLQGEPNHVLLLDYYYEL
jgi:hypothetical protein